MDGYLEAYHHDSVHANTLSKHTIGNLLVHDIFGHHPVLTMARRNIAALDAVPAAQWDAGDYIRRVSGVFPTFQISGIRGGHFLIRQILPGPTPATSTTNPPIFTRKTPLHQKEIH